MAISESDSRLLPMGEIDNQNRMEMQAALALSAVS